MRNHGFHDLGPTVRGLGAQRLTYHLVHVSYPRATRQAVETNAIQQKLGLLKLDNNYKNLSC